MRMFVSELSKHENKEVILKGFMRKFNDLKNVVFITFLDITGSVQVVLSKNEIELYQKAKAITLESAIVLKGIVRAATGSKKSEIEVLLTDIEIETMAHGTIPIDFSEQSKTGLDIKLDNRYLDLRTKKNMLIFKIQTMFEMVMREYFISHDFIEIHTPK